MAAISADVESYHSTANDSHYAEPTILLLGTTTSVKNTQPSIITADGERAIHNHFISERPAAIPGPPLQICVAIPTIPWNFDCGYLSQVLERLEEAKFPPDRQGVYVFFNGHRNKTHSEWDEGHLYHSSQGVHFVWNGAPIPTPHPAALNASLK